MPKYKGFSKKELSDIYSSMYLSRRLDDKQLILLKQGKGFFHIGASGHEAVEIAASKNIKPGIDYSYPYYREQAFCIGLGMTSKDIFMSFLAKEGDPNSSGRQMPQHFGSKNLNIVSQSSPTGTQFLQAVGAAFALKKKNQILLFMFHLVKGQQARVIFMKRLTGQVEKRPLLYFTFIIITMLFQFLLKIKSVANLYLI